MRFTINFDKTLEINAKNAFFVYKSLFFKNFRAPLAPESVILELLPDPISCVSRTPPFGPRPPPTTSLIEKCQNFKQKQKSFDCDKKGIR